MQYSTLMCNKPHEIGPFYENYYADKGAYCRLSLLVAME